MAPVIIPGIEIRPMTLLFSLIQMRRHPPQLIDRRQQRQFQRLHPNRFASLEASCAHGEIGLNLVSVFCEFPLHTVHPDADG